MINYQILRPIFTTAHKNIFGKNGHPEMIEESSPRRVVSDSGCPVQEESSALIGMLGFTCVRILPIHRFNSKQYQKACEDNAPQKDPRT